MHLAIVIKDRGPGLGGKPQILGSFRQNRLKFGPILYRGRGHQIKFRYQMELSIYNGKHRLEEIEQRENRVLGISIRQRNTNTRKNSYERNAFGQTQKLSIE